MYLIIEIGISFDVHYDLYLLGWQKNERRQKTGQFHPDYLCWFLILKLCLITTNRIITQNTKVITLTWIRQTVWGGGVIVMRSSPTLNIILMFNHYNRFYVFWLPACYSVNQSVMCIFLHGAFFPRSSPSLPSPMLSINGSAHLRFSWRVKKNLTHCLSPFSQFYLLFRV